MPERDSNKMTVKIPPCDVCEEAKARSRSRSPSLKNRSNEMLNERLDDCHNVSRSSSASGASFDELLKLQQQKRNPFSNSSDLLNRSNDTYTVSQWAQKPFQTCDLPPKSSLKSPNHDRIESEVSNEFTKYQVLLQKLIETEGVGNEIAKQLSALKDFLRLICNVGAFDAAFCLVELVGVRVDSGLFQGESNQQHVDQASRI